MKIDGEVIEFIGQPLLSSVVATPHGITANEDAHARRLSAPGGAYQLGRGGRIIFCNPNNHATSPITALLGGCMRSVAAHRCRAARRYDIVTRCWRMPSW
jgi:hypothetical protein